VPEVPAKPPFLARLRLPSGYLTILAAFVVNDGDFQWWALALVVLGSAIRVWSAGTLVKVSELATEGPYALSRNPLYLGTFLAGLGLTLFVHSAALLVFFVAAFYITYTAQIDWEERVLMREHGDAFRRYMSQVGRWVTLRVPKARLRGALSTKRLLGNKEVAYQVFWLVMMLGLMTQGYLDHAGIGLAHH